MTDPGTHTPASHGPAALPATASAPPVEPDVDAERRGRMAKLQSTAAHPLFAVLTGLIGLVIAFTIVDGSAFASVANFRNIALDVSITLVLAVGVTYVIITAGFDLSVGSVLVFAGIVAMKAMMAIGGNGWGVSLIGLAVGMLAGGAWGVINGSLVAYAGLNPIIVTLGTLGAALGLAEVISSGQDLVNIPNAMLNFGAGRLLGIPNLAFVALAVAVVAGVVLAKTRFGRHTYAIGSSKEAATRAGLRVRHHLVAVYAISGVCAGVASWLALARFSTTGIAAHSLDNLDAATAALLGGISIYGGVGTVLGTVCGAFIPVILANGLVIANVQSYWQQAVTGGVLILAVYIDRERRRRNE